MSNSSLVSYTKISPNRTSPRNHAIDTITIHCYVGQVSVESMGSWFSHVSAEASSNYGIGVDGRVGMFVEEKDRSWCSSNRENDHRAITIECASDKTDPYAINDKVYATLIKLCADICKRNNIKKLIWKADKSLIGKPDKQNMTVHRWFANKSCPGDYIYSRLGKIADEVNALLGVTPAPETTSDGPYRVRLAWNNAKSQIGSFDVLENAVKVCNANPGYSVYNKSGKAVHSSKETTSKFPMKVQIKIPNLNIRTGPDKNKYPTIGKYTGVGIFTIVDIQNGSGSSKGWGLLKAYESGRNGWISLDYATEV